MIVVLKDDTELFKRLRDDEDLRRWLTEATFNLTYHGPEPASPEGP